jgi:hypothetical protein
MLAKGSFSDTGDVSISDLTLSERKTLDEWLQHFHRKYIHVGDLV